jgi:hypothetical protein
MWELVRAWLEPIPKPYKYNGTMAQLMHHVVDRVHRNYEFCDLK